jgi:hypothetical protein
MKKKQYNRARDKRQSRQIIGDALIESDSTEQKGLIALKDSQLGGDTPRLASRYHLSDFKQSKNLQTNFHMETANTIQFGRSSPKEPSAN